MIKLLKEIETTKPLLSWGNGVVVLDKDITTYQWIGKTNKHGISIVESPNGVIS